jgi:hypothetical protein
MQYVRVICRNPFQVTMFKARTGEGEADLLAHRLRQVLMSAEDNYEIDVLDQETVDLMIADRIDPRVNRVTPSDDIPPIVA